MVLSTWLVVNVQRPQWRGKFGRLKRCVASLAEDKRHSVDGRGEPLHLGDEEAVIAGVVLGPGDAFEDCGNTKQGRRLRPARRDPRTFPLVRLRSREPIGDVLLVL